MSEKNIVDPAHLNVDVSNLTSYDCASIFGVYDEIIETASFNEKSEKIDYYIEDDQWISDCVDSKNKTDFRNFFKELLVFELSRQQETRTQNETESFSNHVVVSIRSEKLGILECIRDYCVEHCEQIEHAPFEFFSPD